MEQHNSTNASTETGNTVADALEQIPVQLVRTSRYPDRPWHLAVGRSPAVTLCGAVLPSPGAPAYLVEVLDRSKPQCVQCARSFAAWLDLQRQIFEPRFRLHQLVYAAASVGRGLGPFRAGDRYVIRRIERSATGEPMYELTDPWAPEGESRGWLHESQLVPMVNDEGETQR